MLNPIFVAIDTPDLEAARKLAADLSGHVGGIKVGLEFFCANGVAGVLELTQLGMPIFLDLKFHDIPNTVAGALRGAMTAHPSILNVHATGGEEMMKTAVATVEECAANMHCKKPLLIAVTILTSLDIADLYKLGSSDAPQKQVTRLAKLSQDCGLDGVVCSALEISAVREVCGNSFKLIVPGIRPEGNEMGDQKRTLTPKQALENGADYIVIGRPITSAADPVAAAQAINSTLLP